MNIFTGHLEIEHNDEVDDFLKNDFNSILEVGGSELSEAKAILKKKKLRYCTANISDFFLEFVDETDGVEGFKADMVDLPFEDKQFDLVYASSVLEHSPDIESSIVEFARVGKRFYFNMFKWLMHGGSLKSQYRERRQFFSTAFNIHKLMGLIGKYGKIEKKFISKRVKKGKVSFDRTYGKSCTKDYHRNGNFLTLIGTWK